MSRLTPRRRAGTALAVSLVLATSGLTAAAGPAAAQEVAQSLRLTLLHNNDGESALLPSGARGGIARFGTLVNELRTQAEAQGGVLLLSSGDNFLAGPQLQASLENDDGDTDYSDDGPFYDAVALDYLDYDASAVGNHEFDFGPNGLGYFLSQFEDSNIRFVSSNLDVTGEEALEQFVAPSPGTPGTLVEWTRTTVDGRSVAIVGATTPRLPSITSPGPDVEAREDVQAAVQDAIDAATADGTDVVVLIAHLQNIAEDQALVGELSGVDAVIAGGGDELLANADDLLLPADPATVPFGPYPLLEANADGVEVPIVTTQGSYGYLGRLVLDIDADGEVTAIDPTSGPVRNVFNATTPPADQKTPDPFLLENVEQPVRAFTAALDADVVVQSDVVLDARTPVNRREETNLGSLFADALRRTAEQGAPEFGATNPTVALQNSGGIRSDTTYGPGAISRLDSFQIAPFSNFVGYTIGLEPAKLKELLERSVSANLLEDGSLQSEGRFGQISGIELVYDPARTAQQVERNADGSVTITTSGDRVREITLTNNTPDPADDLVVVRNGVVVPRAPSVDFAANSFTVGQNGDNYPFNLAEGEFINLPATYQQSFESRLRELGTVTAANYPVGGLGRIVVASEPATAFDSFERLSGADRFGTAAAIAQDAFPAGATTAVLARGDVFADALAGNYLAGALGAPILLTRSGDLPAQTADALEALGVTDVVIVGGVSAVSQAVQAELAADYDVSRLGGADRYATGLLVAEAAADEAGTVAELGGLRTAIVGSGQGFADILAAGPISYARNHPLLITRPGSLPGETASFLTDNDIEQVVIVGGTTAVSAAVEAELEELTGNVAVRVEGADRFATAANLAEAAYTLFGFDRSKVNLARADEPNGFADALAAGPSSGEDLAPLVLTFPAQLPVPTRQFLADNSDTLESGTVLGGLQAVNQAVQTQAESAAAGGVS